MATLFEKIKKYLGITRDINYGYYTIQNKTAEPVKVSYEQPAPAPVPEPEPVVPEPLSSQEAAVDTKDDGIDLAAMTKPELVSFATERGIAGVSARLKKQEIIDKINAAL